MGQGGRKQPGENSSGYVYLGRDMLKANIGLEAASQGRNPILHCWMQEPTGMMQKGNVISF